MATPIKLKDNFAIAKWTMDRLIKKSMIGFASDATPASTQHMVPIRSISINNNKVLNSTLIGFFTVTRLP